MLQGPRFTASEDELADASVQHTPKGAQGRVEGRPGVPHWPQVLPDPAGAHTLLIAVYREPYTAGDRQCRPGSGVVGSAVGGQGWCEVAAQIDCLPAVGEFAEELVRASKALSAASMPLFMALWVPLILGTLRKPGLHPISAPPGKVSLGMLWMPPSFRARAPYDILRPPSSRRDT